MNCHDFSTQLNQIPERGPLPLRTQLEQHAAECPVCGALWDNNRLLDDAISACREQTPQVDLLDAVIDRHFRADATAPIAEENGYIRDARLGQPAQVQTGRAGAGDSRQQPARVLSKPFDVLRAGSSHDNRRFNGVHQSIVAVVAGIAVLVVVMLSIPDSSSFTRLTGRSVVNNLPPMRDARLLPVKSRAPEVGVMVRDAGEAYLALAQETVGALQDASLLMAPIGTPSSNTTIPADRFPALDAIPDWLDMDSLKQEFKPIGESVGNAFGFLLSKDLST